MLFALGLPRKIVKTRGKKMNEKFIEKLYKAIIKDGIDEYKDLLGNTNLEDATDKYWEKSLALYKNLTADNREKMLKFAELVMIDAISNIFGVLDGSTSLPEESFECKVSINGNSTENELQDTFLAYVEDIAESQQ